MDTRIEIRSQVNPENCIGYESIYRLTYVNSRLSLWNSKALHIDSAVTVF